MSLSQEMQSAWRRLGEELLYTCNGWMWSVAEGASMATYILLGTLTDEGADKLRLHPEWLTDVKENLEKTGIKVIAQYAVLGQYDIVNIVEAPDNKSIVRVSTELTLRGILKITTLPALPIEDFLATLR